MSDPVYYSKNREKILEKAKEYYQRNREIIIEKRKQRLLDPEFKEKRLERERERNKNRVRKKCPTKSEDNKLYYQKHKERMLIDPEYAESYNSRKNKACQNYKSRNREKVRQRDREYYHRTIAYQAERSRTYALKNRKKISEYYKNRLNTEPEFKERHNKSCKESVRRKRYGEFAEAHSIAMNLISALKKERLDG